MKIPYDLRCSLRCGVKGRITWMRGTGLADVRGNNFLQDARSQDGGILLLVFLLSMIILLSFGKRISPVLTF